MIPTILRWIAGGTLRGATLRAASVGMLLLVLLGPGVVLAADGEQGVVRIVFAGDVMLDGGPGHTIVHGGDPFAEFESVLRGADISVCNLECVLADGGEQVLKPYTFRAPQESLPLLQKYFTAVGLANNHMGDFGKDAFARELTTLENAKLPYFGGGRNRQEARRPLILERNGVRVALLGYNDFQSRAFAAGEDTPGNARLDNDEVLADVRTARNAADVVISRYLPTGSSPIGRMFGINSKYIHWWFSQVPLFQYGWTGFKGAKDDLDVAGQFLVASNILCPSPRTGFQLQSTLF